jgi:hypothetical protein
VENGSKNILIEYTKWILRGGYIIILGLCVLGGAFWSYGTYVESTVPMIALSCESDLKNIPDRAVLIMKKRFEDTPEGMYWGPHYNKDFNLSTSVTDLYRYGYYIKLRGDNYVFSGDPKIIVNRQTLSMKAEHLGTAWLIMHLQCYKISTDKFYELVGKETKERKKKLEF